MKPRRLLIIPCSKTKDETPELLTAWERYQGRVFLRLKEINDYEWDDRDIDIVIISGKYGFLRPYDLIEAYDQLMTPELAASHHQQVVECLSKMLASNVYHDCFVMLEPEYLATLEGIDIPNAQFEHKIDQQSLERLRLWVIQGNR